MSPGFAPMARSRIERPVAETRPLRALGPGELVVPGELLAWPDVRILRHTLVECTQALQHRRQHPAAVHAIRHDVVLLARIVDQVEAHGKLAPDDRPREALGGPKDD